MIARRTILGAAALGGVAAALLPLRRARSDQIRRIGNLMHIAETDREGPRRVAAFIDGLRRLGWIDGANIRIEHRWAAGDPELYRRFAEELVALKPDVILATASPSVAALQKATGTVPIVFVQVIDPLAGGFVKSLARPEGNITGFSSFDYTFSSKWVQLLREVAPDTRRIAVLRDPTITVGRRQLEVIESIASSLGLEVTPLDVRDAGELERAIAAFGATPGGGMIVTASPSVAAHRVLTIRMAARLRLPAIYPFAYYASDGGLIAYGPDWDEQYRSAAGYVDRILKGEKPGDLPVQAPTKYELVLNQNAARDIGLVFPPSMLAQADEVIE